MTLDLSEQQASPLGSEFELANRMFFRLYQCANILHKVGSRAVEAEGLTTQRWAVMGALSRLDTGMAVGELARYLQVSRQSLAGVIGPLVDEGLITVQPCESDRRSREYVLTERGRTHWRDRAIPKITAFYADATAGMSIEDMSHTLHYLVRLIENMNALDERS
ncbi:MAG: MarR family winged helix-turn-helix transcriptional regulator [Ilumatobacteraceae bacterium]